MNNYRNKSNDIHVHDVFLLCHVCMPADKHTVRLFTWRQDNKYYTIQVFDSTLTRKAIFHYIQKSRLSTRFSPPYIWPFQKLHYYAQKTQYKGKRTAKRIVKYAYNNKQKALCDTKDDGNCWKRGGVPSISHYQSNLQWHFNTLLTLEHIQCSMYNSSGCCYDNIKIYEWDYYGDRRTPRPRCILLTKSNNLMC